MTTSDCSTDLEQRAGRILRYGNTNENINIYRYITAGTFDSYLWQILENKQKFISQILTSKTPIRSMNEMDELTLEYAEIKELATGNPLLKEKMQLDNELSNLKILNSMHIKNKQAMENKIKVDYPIKISTILL